MSAFHRDARLGGEQKSIQCVECSRCSSSSSSSGAAAAAMAAAGAAAEGAAAVVASDGLLWHMDACALRSSSLIDDETSIERCALPRVPATMLCFAQCFVSQTRRCHLFRLFFQHLHIFRFLWQLSCPKIDECGRGPLEAHAHVIGLHHLIL